MHAFDAPSGRTYFHDGDMAPGSTVEFETTVRRERTVISIPMEDVLALAAAHLRGLRIAKLESASYDEILGILTKE